MAFDPDAYIAGLPKKGEPAAFDPDAYIKAKGLGTASVPNVQRISTPVQQQEEPGFFARARESLSHAAGAIKAAGGELIDTRGAALLDPAKRHALERGIADAVTGGLATKVAEHFGFPTPQQEPEDPNYRATGAVAGSFAPNPFSYVGGKVAGKALGPLAEKTMGKAAGAVVGAAKGGIGYEASAIPLAATQAAAEGQNPIEAAYAASRDPLGLILGVGVGAGTGAARGKANAIESPKTISGRTLGAIKAAGGEIGPRGVTRGLYETPDLAGLPKGRAGVNELAHRTQGEMLGHGRERLTNARANYETEMERVLGENGPKPITPLEAMLALNKMENDNTTFEGKTLDPAKAKFIRDMTDKLSSQIETDVPVDYSAPPRSPDVEPAFAQWPPQGMPQAEPTTMAGIKPRVSGTPEPTASPSPVNINEIRMETPGGVPLSDVPDLNLSGEPSPFGKTTPAAVTPRATRLVDVPEVTAEDLVKIKKYISAKADWNNPGTAENHHFREMYGALVKDAEAIDPRIGQINKQYGATMEGLKRVNDILFGKNRTDIADRAASEKQAALKLGRVGDETQAATAEAPQIEELRKADPVYAQMLRLLEAKKAQERARFGEPEVSTGFEKGQHRAAGHGAARLGLGVLGAKVGSVFGPVGTAAGAALGYKAADVLRNPIANDLRLKLPAAKFIGSRQGLGPGLSAVEAARAEQRRKEGERINSVLGGLNLTQANPEQPLVYVDRIEGDKAVLLDDAGDTHNVDISALPQGAKPGAWIQGGSVVPAPESKSQSIRKRLSAGDKGGRIAL